MNLKTFKEKFTESEWEILNENDDFVDALEEHDWQTCQRIANKIT
jgi:hypothetical protein